MSEELTCYNCGGKGWHFELCPVLKSASTSPASEAGELPPMPWENDKFNFDFEAWIEPRDVHDVRDAFHQYARAALASTRNASEAMKGWENKTYFFSADEYRTASTDAATRSRAEGGNTCKESAEVDVEAERKLFFAHFDTTSTACDRWEGWLAKARTQADAGKDDTKRLDWLEAHCTGASDSERYLPFRIYWGNKGATKGIRATIDKARAATTTKPENT